MALDWQVIRSERADRKHLILAQSDDLAVRNVLTVLSPPLSLSLSLSLSPPAASCCSSQLAVLFLPLWNPMHAQPGKGCISSDPHYSNFRSPMRPVHTAGALIIRLKFSLSFSFYFSPSLPFGLFSSSPSCYSCSSSSSSANSSTSFTQPKEIRQILSLPLLSLSPSYWVPMSKCISSYTHFYQCFHLIQRHFTFG